MDIDEVVTKCREAGELWATNSAAYHRFDKGLKTKLAEVKQKVRSSQTPPLNKTKWTREDLEDAAYVHSDWTTFMNTFHDNYEKMITSKVDYDNWRNALDAYRSKMATERVEYKNG